jgi:hypothetical protein
MKPYRVYVIRFADCRNLVFKFGKDEYQWQSWH